MELMVSLNGFKVGTLSKDKHGTLLWRAKSIKC